MDKRPLLSVRDLRVSFPGPGGVLRAVRGLSYDVLPGETLGIVGESGSGKSVAAYAVLGLLRPPGRVDGGQALFDGRDLLTMDRQELTALRGGEISMIFQDPLSSLDPCFSIGKQLTEALRAHGSPTKEEARAEALAALRSVGLREPERLLGQYPFELSGGMRQRVMIAMALLCRPRLLIADEPTTALDVTVQARILNRLKALRVKNDMSMVFITHNFGVVVQLCGRVLVMYGGVAVERGPVAAVFAAPAHPYTRLLLAAIPRMNGSRALPLPTVPGVPLDPLSPPEGCPFMPRCPLAGAQCRTLPPERPVGAEHSAACWRLEDAHE